MSQRRAALVLATALALSSATLAAAETNRTVEVEGTASLSADLTFDQAWKRAVDQARAHAIEMVSGAEVSHIFASSATQDNRRAFSIGVAEINGHVVDEQVLSSVVEFERKSAVQVPPAVLRVRLRAKVVAEDPPDPAFKVNLSLERNTLRAGEPLRFTVQCTREAYLTVVNLAADDKVYVLYPNQYTPTLKVTNGATLTLPAPSDSFEIRPRPVGGHQSDPEFVKVVATLSPPLALPPGHKDGLMVPDFYRWLLSVPRRERVEATAPYHVFAAK